MQDGEPKKPSIDRTRSLKIAPLTLKATELRAAHVI